MLVQACGAAFNALVSFALVLFLARTFGTDQFGHFVALLGLGLVALALIEGGWPTVVYRAGASDDATGGLRLGNGVAHSLAVGTALVAASLVLAAQPAWRALPAAIACMAGVAAMNLVSARMRSQGKFALEAGWQVGGRLASAGAIVATVLVAGASAGAVFLSWLAGLALVLAAGAHWLARPSREGLVPGYAEALPLAAIEAGVVVLTRSETTVIGALGLSAPSLSIYGACTRLNEAALLLGAAASNVLVQRLARDAAGTRAQLPGLLVGAMAAGTVCWALAWIAGEWLTPRLFGAEYAEAGVLLPWVAASLPFALSNLLLLQILIARRRDRALLLLVGCGALLHVLATALGLGLGGMDGAAIGAASAQALVLLAFARAVFFERSDA